MTGVGKQVSCNSESANLHSAKLRDPKKMLRLATRLVQYRGGPSDVSLTNRVTKRIIGEKITNANKLIERSKVVSCYVNNI